MAKVNPIAPRVAGQVDKLFVEPGEVVKRGEPLFQLYSRGYEIRVKEAQGNLKAAESALNKAKKQREIALGLQEADPESISRLQLINTEETMNKLQGQYDAAKSALDDALHDLSKTTVYAPAEGLIPFVAFDKETPVAAYTPLMSFISLSDMFPAGVYTQNALAFVRIGDRVEFLLDIYPGQIFKAEVEEIIWAAGEAQVFQGQTIPFVNKITPPTQFVVKMKMQDFDKNLPLHYGAKGSVVIYTQHWKSLHIIQKVHLRMQSWLKYLAFP